MSQNKTKWLKASNAGLVFGVVMLAMLAGCASSGDGPVSTSKELTPANQTNLKSGTKESYTYFPAYDVYYNTSMEVYMWMENGAWVTRRVDPRNISAEEIKVSPSVKLDFHDSPANHLTETHEKYPKNWKPAVQ